MRLWPAGLLVLAWIAAVTANGQERPDLSGSWLLAPADAAGTEPLRLTIRQSRGELTVVRRTSRGDEESTYRLDGAETIESNMLGEVRIRASWDGPTLVVARTRTLNGPAGPVPTTTTESFTLDDQRLVIRTRQPMPSGGYRTDETVYQREPQR